MRRTLRALRQTVQSRRERRSQAFLARRREQAGEFSVFWAKEWGGTRPVVMTTDRGRDQVATTIASTGWHSFEQPLPRVIAAVAAEAQAAVYDVGANTGFYALLARHVNRAVTVRGFEPYPPVLELLQRNVVMNGSTIDVVPAAVGAGAGRARLYVPTQSHGLVETSASLDPAFTHAGHDGTVEVDVITLDEFNAAFAHERVAMVKIDVEGMEHAVLAGAGELIQRHQPWLIVEVLPTSDIAALEQHRAAAGYVDVLLHPRGATLAEEVAFCDSAWNHLWVPRHDTARMMALLEHCQLLPSRLAA